MNIGRIFILVFLIWIFIYTASYGVWTWKRENKLGAIMLMLLAAASLALPVYALLFREG
ncbi:MAG: hypothetical protein N2489_09055 [Clostridia bacterium]|nr:hypothetical protein [Clostridia bacterium]